MRRLIALTLCVLAAGLGTACGRPTPPNVVFVVVDTLRPDRLGVYGDGRGLTPFVDSLAERAYVFHRAYAQSSWTNPSVASMLTSRYQSQHNVISFGSVLPDEELTLPELLKQRGYATGAVVANILLQPRLGYGQGFDHYKVSARTRTGPLGKPEFLKGRADAVNNEAFAWLDGLSAPRPPVFLYLQYMEPHAPYDPPDAAVQRVLGDRERPDLTAVNTRMFASLPGQNDDLADAVATYYDAEVTSLDGDLRALFDGLAQRGVLDNAIVIFTADHGEELNEHGLLGHHQTLYEEVIHVPLLVLATGYPHRTDVDDVVELVDLAPTIADLADIPRPAAFEGRSLAESHGVGREHGWARLRRRLLHNDQGPETAVSELAKAPQTLSLSPHLRAVIRDTDKMITDTDGEHVFYDLATDPGEHHPGQLAEPKRAALTSADAAFGTEVARHAGPAGAPVLDAETKERMRALGYAE
jgi:arylsulfatase A-like enzyme